MRELIIFITLFFMTILFLDYIVTKFKSRTKRCKHKHMTLVGYYYTEVLTEWRNCFDEIKVYVRYKCEDCEYIVDELFAIEKYTPELYHTRSIRKEEYIKILKLNGIVDLVSFKIKLLEEKKIISIE